jgi:hypothetical protein
LRIPINDSLAGFDHRPGHFMCALVMFALATPAILVEAARNKRVFPTQSKNASAQARENVPAGDAFAMRRQFPADKISVLTR